MNERENQIVSGLKPGQTIEVETEHGSVRGVVKKLTNMLVVIVLLEPLTSEKSHSYHWDAGELKSILFKRMIKIRRLMYFDSVIPFST